jgi:glycosyltransferase involved in cell wall biosynthesis
MLAPQPVLHVVNGEHYAGAERVQELLAQRLPSFGYQVTFACLKSGEFHRRLERQRHQVHDFIMRFRFDVIQARRIAHHALESGCVLIHTHTPRSVLVGAVVSAITGLPLVHHVHSPTSRNTADPWSDRLNTMVEKIAVRRAAALIPVSGSLAGYLEEEGYHADRVTVIPNGVAISDAEVQHAVGRELTVGMVALFRPRKGLEILLEALARLSSRGRRVRLLAVGRFESDDYRDAVLRLARRLAIEPLIEWRGFREDVLGELERMDLMVLPSLYGEGMPMVILEAMAVGLPVVASRVEGVSEVVSDRREGLLVEPGDVAALANAIAELDGNRGDLVTMGVRGRRRQRLEFSDLSMAWRLSEVYREVVDRHRGHAVATRDETMEVH